MSAPARLYVDVSFTRTQPAAVGITRTVRALATQLGALCGAQPVVYHPGGFRQASLADLAPAAASRPGASSAVRQALAGPLRRLGEQLPARCAWWAWRLLGAQLFRRLGATAAPLALRPGDCVLLADESWNYPVASALRQARAQGARVVVLLYDLIPLRQPQFCPAPFTLAFAHWLRSVSLHADAVLCISRSTELDYRAWCAESGLAPLPSASFRLGSDLPAPAAVPGASVAPVPALQSLLGSGRPCFAMVGTLEPRKNHAFVLAAFERLWASGLDLALVIAGRPHPRCAALLARLRSHPEAGRRLLLLLDASDADIAALYAGARALVFASLAEGFGLPLVEARTRGCPVLASDIPALAEIADAGVRLFPPGDAAALEALLRADAVHDRREGLPSMPAFTWADSAKACLQALGQLLGPAWAARR